MSDPKLLPFENQTYLNLETFRKSGLGVPTPVWFVQDGETLYVGTVDNSGKVKRIRNNAHVRIAPCDMGGGLLGEWVDAQAHMVTDPAVFKRVDHLLTRKYGIQKWLFVDLAGWFQKRKGAIVAIQI
jgi:hypothetical protein